MLDLFFDFGDCYHGRDAGVEKIDIQVSETEENS